MKLVIDVDAGVSLGGIPLIFLSTLFQKSSSREEETGMKICAAIGALITVTLVAGAAWWDY